MTKEELQEVLRLHGMWLRGEEGGKRADLDSADLRGADLSGVDLSRADLSRADLRGVDLSRANLWWANLSHADLRLTDLRDADMRRAALGGANMSMADLDNADLRDADMSGTNLSKAEMRYADLRGAYLAHGPNVNCLSGQPVYQVAGVGDSRRAVTLLAVGERKDWRWFAGCFEGSEEELRTAVTAKYQADSAGYRGYMRSIDYLVAMAEDGEEVEP